MKIDKKKLLIFGGAGIGTLAVGAGVTAGIIIPIAKNKAKSALSAFVPEGGGQADLAGNLAKRKKLKIVALGDSVTAGNNGLLGKDTYSYADFMAESFKNLFTNANEFKDRKYKVEYKNYAKSGLRMADWNMLLEDPNVVRQIKDADIIPLTIGSNDILSFLKLFGTQVYQMKSILGGAKNILAQYDFDNHEFKAGAFGANDKDQSHPLGNESVAKWAGVNNFPGGGLLDVINKGSVPENNDTRKSFNSNTTVSMKDGANMFLNTINALKAITSGEGGEFFNIDKDFVSKVFDLEKRNMVTIIRDLHTIAPNAQIVVLGPNLPYAQFPQKVLFGKNKASGNKSLIVLFNKLLDDLKNGAKTSLEGENNYVDFYKADELPDVSPYTYQLKSIYTPDAKGTYDKYKGKKFQKVDYKSEASFEKSIKDNIVPNIADIHPTIFGHQKIAKSLFGIYASRLGAKKTEIDSAVAKFSVQPQKDVASTNTRIHGIYNATKEMDTMFNKLIGNAQLHKLITVLDGLIDSQLANLRTDQDWVAFVNGVYNLGIGSDPKYSKMWKYILKPKQTMLINYVITHDPELKKLTNAISVGLRAYNEARTLLLAKDVNNKDENRRNDWTQINSQVLPGSRPVETAILGISGIFATIKAMPGAKTLLQKGLLNLLIDPESAKATQPASAKATQPASAKATQDTITPKKAAAAKKAPQTP